MTPEQVFLTHLELVLLASIEAHIRAEEALDAVESDIMRRDGRGKAIAADAIERVRYGIL